MHVVSISSRKKSWQTERERVSVLAALAIQKETVVRRLERLREDIGHPEKPGKPLTQAQAAARVGVEARTWQRWESGAVVPYARHLDAIATEFGFAVSEFYDGDKAEPLNITADAIGERLSRMEQQLTDQLAEHARHVEALLARQSAILTRIEQLVLTLPSDEQTEELLQALEDEGRTAQRGETAAAGTARARGARRRAAGQ